MGKAGKKVQGNRGNANEQPKKRKYYAKNKVLKRVIKRKKKQYVRE